MMPEIQEDSAKIKELDDRIMLVGGEDFKLAKDQLELLDRKMLEKEKQLTRDKATLANS